MDTIDAYKILIKKSTFTIEQILEMTGNQPAAYALVKRLIKKGLVVRVRQNLYSAMNLITDRVVASKYQIACSVNDKAYLCLHSAAEAHGLLEASSEIQVSSEIRFRSFRFEGNWYKYVSPKIHCGVISCPDEPEVRMTDLERTLLDAVNQSTAVGGAETLVQCLEQMSILDEGKITEYLEVYNSNTLYQKVGFLLSQYQRKFGLSSGFLEMCHDKVGLGSRDLTTDSRKDGIYDNKWKIIAPKWIKNEETEEEQASEESVPGVKCSLRVGLDQK